METTSTLGIYRQYICNSSPGDLLLSILRFRGYDQDTSSRCSETGYSAKELIDNES